jgi:signal transduction histidine kinase
MGLAIVKKIVDMYWRSITIESKKNVWTTFTLIMN